MSTTGVVPARVAHADSPVQTVTQLRQPTVTAVSPASGTTSGGAIVTVSGSGFLAPSTTVAFGGSTLGTNVAVTSDSQLTVTTPARCAGLVDVTVTTAAGTSPTSTADQFLYVAQQPAVTGVAPISGSSHQATTVTITGTDLFCSTSISAGAVTPSVVTTGPPNTPTQLTISMPPQPNNTVADVRVTTAGGTSGTTPNDNFIWLANPPTITALSQNSGPSQGGGTLTISGTGLAYAGSVRFGSISSPRFVANSDTQVTATIPPGCGQLPVTVTTGGGTSNGLTYTFTTGTPVITGISPAGGPTGGGNAVTLTGTNLGCMTAANFGAAPASGAPASDTLATVTAPSQPPGVVGVTVSNPSGTSSSTSYSYQAAPTVTAVSPNAGPVSGGTSVTITGTGFTSDAQVSFGNTPAASLTVNSSTSITATSPGTSAPAEVDVVVTTLGGSSSTSFADRFAYGVPTVSAITPTSGPLSGGTSVQVTGTNFVSGSTVTFGSAAATSVIVDASGTSLTATSPSGSSGPVDIVVANPAGASTTSAADVFTYRPRPTINWVGPSPGRESGGVTVTVTGSGFVAGATTVTFGSAAATNVTVHSPTYLTVASPPLADGDVHVTVTTPGGSSADPPYDTYTVIPPPTVSSISPTAGPAAGGTTITVTGSNFRAGDTSVYIGGNTTLTPTASSSTSLTVTAPASSSCSVGDVVVSTGGGNSPTSSADLYAYGPPSVTSVSPAAGAASGGTAITVQGCGFVPGVTVSVGGQPATSVVWVSATTLTAVAPAGSPGVVDVLVTNPAGTSTAGSSDHFQYDAAPTVSGVSPTAGPLSGGTSLTVTGTNFVAGSTTVAIGGVQGTSVSVASSTSLTVHTPSTSSAGTVDVVVTTPGGASATSAADQFTYDPVPAVTGVSPAGGSTNGGTSVTVTGTGFIAGSTTVLFGLATGTSVSVTSTTSLTVVSPASPSGAVDVTVSTPGGTSPVTAADRYEYGPATVTGVSPNAGPTGGGTTVTVSGSDFVAGSTTVAFGGVAATNVSVSSSSTLTAVSPAGSAGRVDVVVTVPGGSSATSSADLFAYGPPSVTSVSPVQGPLGGGTTVTVQGSAFVPGATVAFGGTAATAVSVQSATTLTATAPAHTAATVDVVVTTAAGSSATGTADHYTYDPVPAVTGVSPAGGPTGGGTTVTVSGTGFVSGSTTVRFGSVAGTSVSVTSSSTLTVVSPAASAGTVDVTVSTPGGTSATSSADIFEYGAATVTAVSPDTGPTSGGTTVTVSGSDFVAGSTTVKFGGVAATGVSVASASTLTAVSPAGSAGSVDVVVTVPGGSSATSAADLFAYGPPSVTSISPAAGPLGGGTTVTVHGTAFAPGATVAFGAAAGTNVTVVSATTLTAIAPAHVAGTVDVVVSTAAGSSATGAADHYTYDAAPTVSGISPSAGPLTGGTSVTVTGTGFIGGSTTVSFGGSAGQNVSVPNSTTLTVTSPSVGSAQVVDVVVTTPGGASATSSADHFAYDAAPTVTAVAPNGGSTSGGTSVTITGANFVSGATVTFGSTPSTGVTVSSSTSITATSPAHAAGTVDVQVTTPGGLSTPSSSDQFAFGRPVVTAVSPSSGATTGGTQVTVTGSGFVSGATVAFGSKAATLVLVNSPTSITATSPASSAGAVDITVTTTVGTSTTSAADLFAFGAPAVTGISPTAGPLAGGTSVTITGTGFSSGVLVSFGGTAATNIIVSSGTTLTATSPARSAGIVDVTVSNAVGTSATGSADKFTYDGVPGVTGLNPNNGTSQGSTSVNILGSNFTQGASVKFGTVAATSVTYNSATSLTVVSPAQAGAVDVVVTTPGGSSPTTSQDVFTYTTATSPTVTAVSPAGGPSGGGTAVAITGTNFSSITAVVFGSVNAASYTVNSASSITATSPAGTVNTTVDIVVKASGWSSPTSSADHFTYGNSPTVTGISPAYGGTTGGTSVTITGTNLSPGQSGAPAVSFGSNTATVISSSQTSVVATSPAASTAGTVDITVTTVVGTSTTSAADQFTYYNQPTVTSVSPDGGTVNGGNTVTITGTNFYAPVSVTFDGGPGPPAGPSATNVVINSPTQLTVTAPADPYYPGFSTSTADIAVHAAGGDSIKNSGNQGYTWGTSDWTQQSPATSPVALMQGMMAYDPVRQRAVFFGGYNSAGVASSDTWTWDGTTWTKQNPVNHPSGRWAATFVFDTATGNTILFGGLAAWSSGPLGDTWTWDGTNWTQRSPTASPVPRYGQVSAYDSANSKVLIFSGQGNGVSNDTWTWDGTTWTQQAGTPAPAARYGAAGSADLTHHAVVIWSGCPIAGGGCFTDTWTWNGTTWAQQSPTNNVSDSELWTQMVYDAKTQRPLLFEESLQQFEWTGSDWVQDSVGKMPFARYGEGMAYDGATSTVVLFGGEDNYNGGGPFNDTWTY